MKPRENKVEEKDGNVRNNLYHVVTSLSGVNNHLKYSFYWKQSSKQWLTKELQGIQEIKLGTLYVYNIQDILKYFCIYFITLKVSY